MNIFDYDKNKNELNFVNENFHFSFTNSYADFIKTQNSKLYIVTDNLFSVPVILKKTLFFKTIQFQFTALDNTGKELDIENEKKFISNVLLFLKQKKIAHRIIQPTNFCLFKSYPYKSANCEFGSYFIDLKQSEETILANMQPRYRTSIRAAIKLNPVIKTGVEELNSFWSLYKETMVRTNMYYETFIDLSSFAYSLSNNCFIANIYLNNELQGGVFISYTKHGAYYLHGASNNQVQSDGVVKYLHYWCMCYFKKQGVGVYDFVGARASDVFGTKLEGIQNFKRRFGSELKTGYLWKKDIHNFHCLLYDTILKIKLLSLGVFLPLDIIDAENSKISNSNQKFVTWFKNRITYRIINEIKKVSKSFRILKLKISKEQLIKEISQVEINEDDVLLIHSSLSKIGNVANGPKTIVEAFLEKVGVNGTIVMPAYSYINSMEETGKMKDFIFKPETNKSVVGIITETFRKLENVKRSLHPTHSVCAIGKHAQYITEGHLNALTNFGENTPFHRIRELKGKIVGVGINIGHVTIYHTIEDFFPNNFKTVYYPEPATINIEIDGKIIEKSVKIHNPKYHAKRIDKDPEIENWFRNHLLKKGILHEGKFGETKIWWMNIQTLFDELVILKSKGITIYNISNAS